VKVSEIGEFGLIKLLADEIEKTGKIHPHSRHIITGIGDDAAVWQSDDLLQIATTDSLVQDTHFNLSYASWDDIGYKSIAINLSDIAAMGGVPRYVLVSLAIPGETEVEHVMDAYHGMIRIANRFGASIIGGNIAAADKVILSVTAFGTLNDDTALTRSSASPGDKIAITGYTGLSAAGLQMMKERQRFNPDIDTMFRKAHLQPLPRIEEGQILRELGVKTAIDISDGLIADLSHICSISRVEAVIRQDLLPVHPMLKSCFPENVYKKFILNGGEDYELLFTAPGHIMEQVIKKISCPVTVIGEIADGMPGQVSIIEDSTKTIIQQPSGWDHFKS
jgi:thiamine-monophosphate kinase